MKSSLKLNNKILTQLLLILLLISFSLGNAAVNIALLLLLISNLDRFLNINFMKNFFYENWIIFLFFTYLIFNSFFVSPDLSNLNIIRFFIIILIGYFSFNFILKSKNIFFSILLYSSMISMDILITYFFNINFFNFSNPELYTGIFEDEQIVGSYLSKLLVIFFGLYFYLNKKIFHFNDFIYFFLILLITYVLALSNERRAIIDLILSLILLNIFFFNKKNFIISILYIIIFFSITISNKNIRDEIYKKSMVQFGFSKTISDKNFNEKNDEPTGNLTDQEKTYQEKTDQEKFGILFKDTSLTKNQYFAMYYTSYNIWTDNILFGVGGNNYREECKKKKYEYDNNYSKIRCNTHPHNIYLQILAELGLVGFTLFILVIYKVIYSNLLNKRKNIIKIFLILFIVFLIPLPSGNIFSSWLGSIFWLTLGFLLNDTKPETN
jgi:O-antigen ligase